MPIKPENKSLYPPDWPEIRIRIRNRAGNRCEGCGIANHLVIKRLVENSYRTPSSQEWDMIHCKVRYGGYNFTSSIKLHGFIRIVCTVAHRDHDPTNNSDDNLAFWCQRCHNRYDRAHRNQTISDSKVKNQLKLQI